MLVWSYDLSMLGIRRIKGSLSNYLWASSIAKDQAVRIAFLRSLDQVKILAFDTPPFFERS